MMATGQTASRNWIGLPLLAVNLFLWVSNSHCLAEKWVTGDDLDRRLTLEAAIAWRDGDPLRDRLARLAAAQQVCLHLDRRINPDQQVDLTLRNVSLQAVLDEIADQAGGSIARVGPVLVIAPAASASRLPEILVDHQQRVAKQSSGLRNRLQLRTELAWEKLATPREIVAEIAEQRGLRLVEPEKIPHDLWAAAAWPPMTAAEQLTVVLAGFDLGFEISPDGSAMRARPLPAAARFAKTYPLPGDGDDLIAQLQREFPRVQFRVRGRQLQAVALPAEHVAIERRIQGDRPAAPVRGKKVYTLKVENKPAGAIARALAGQIGCEVALDPELGEKLTRRISIDVKEVTERELFQTVADQMGAKLVPVQGGYRLTP